MVWSAAMPVKNKGGDTLQTSDEFNYCTMSPQWEWCFQPRKDKWSLTERPGYLRLYAYRPLQSGNIAKSGNVLTQRALRINSTITVKMKIDKMMNGQMAALGLFGKTSAEVELGQHPVMG
ncbi:MAG: hypothetical protein ABJB86_09615 [Bacteroidota bacterium]